MTVGARLLTLICAIIYKAKKNFKCVLFALLFQAFMDFKES